MLSILPPHPHYVTRVCHWMLYFRNVVRMSGGG